MSGKNGMAMGRAKASVGRQVRSAILAGLCLWGMAAQAAEPASDGSADARAVTRWILDTHDNQGKPFAVVDKKAARLQLYAADGRLIAGTPVLLGLARGDTAIADIAQRAPSSLRPFERTTPAGRFESRPGRNLQGEDIVWIDYDAAVSMHRVRANNKVERRLQRLATPGVGDNRISYGCINVPASFYDTHIRPALGQRKGVVYVLPETAPMQARFSFVAQE